MKNTILILLAIVTMTACGTSKDGNSDEVEIENVDEETQTSVSFTILEKVPYCGGARPMPGAENKTKPVQAKFVITNLLNNNKIVVETDENGQFNQYLSNGKYSIKENYKNVPFDKFLKEQRTEKVDIELGTEDCYKEWWNKSLLDFEVNNEEGFKTTEIIIPVRCNTGINPCDRYTGALAP